MRDGYHIFEELNWHANQCRRVVVLTCLHHQSSCPSSGLDEAHAVGSGWLSVQLWIVQAREQLCPQMTIGFDSAEMVCCSAGPREAGEGYRVEVEQDGEQDLSYAWLAIKLAVGHTGRAAPLEASRAAAVSLADRAMGRPICSQ